MIRLKAEEKARRISLLKSKYPLNLGIETWYILYELLELFERKDPKLYQSKLCDKLRLQYSALTQDLKAVMWDYIPLAAWGEARWAVHHCKYYFPDMSRIGSTKERKRAHLEALSFSPGDFMPKLEKLFHMNWISSSFGGMSWVKICKVWNDPIKNDVVLVDHIIDLQHNGGPFFDKGSLVDFDKIRFMKRMDLKRRGSLIHGRTSFMVYGPYVETAVSVGKERFPDEIRCVLDPCPAPTYVPLEWGKKVLGKYRLSSDEPPKKKKAKNPKNSGGIAYKTIRKKSSLVEKIGVEKFSKIGD